MEWHSIFNTILWAQTNEIIQYMCLYLQVKDFKLNSIPLRENTLIRKAKKCTNFSSFFSEKMLFFKTRVSFNFCSSQVTF